MAIAAGCGGSLGGTGGHGGNGSGGVVGSGGSGGDGAVGGDIATGTGGTAGTGGLGGELGSGGLGGDIVGTTGAGGGCSICSDPNVDVAGCPAGTAPGLLCGVGFPQNGFCCAGSQQFQCNCPLGAPDCSWVATCPATGGATGAGGIRGSGGVGGDIVGTTGAGGLATGGAGGTGAGGSGGGTGSGGSGTGGQSGLACGGQTCAPGQLCVHPGCGGGVAVCTPPQDGGICPAGWTSTDFCSPTAAGCLPPPCDPPPSFCADVPPACAGTPSCGCLPSDICTRNGGTGACGFISATSVTCLSA
jgi:hypothetical protein